MRGRSQGRARSVDRGTCRPGIEPRKSDPPGCRRRGRRRKATLGPSIWRDGLGARAVGGWGRGAAPGSLWTHAGDERLWAVGQPHSTDEVPEQGRGTGGGGDGGRGAGQREPEPANRAPGTGPGRRAQCAGEGAAGGAGGEQGGGHAAASHTHTEGGDGPG